MSYLIDSFKNTSCEIGGTWWISKPILNTSIKTKMKWILEILKGKAIAVHFKEDEKSVNKDTIKAPTPIVKSFIKNAHPWAKNFYCGIDKQVRADLQKAANAVRKKRLMLSERDKK